MKNSRSILMSICVIVAIIVSMAPVPLQAKSKIKINKSSVTIYAGKTISLKVMGTKKKIKWSSNKKKVATVSKKGKVTAKKKGTAVITAKIDKKRYTCKIKVKSPYLNVTQKSMKPGTTYRLKLNGATAKQYVSDNRSVVIVDSKGTISALKSGKANITCTDTKKRKYTCRITVTSEVTATSNQVCSPALAAESKETPWVYSNNGTHREKTMFDGTLLKEDKVELEVANGVPVAQWGWFDDEAASEMNAAVNTALQQIASSQIEAGQEDVWQTFQVDSSYEEDAKRSAFVYARSGGSSQGYHSNHGGLPNVSDNRKTITLVDGQGLCNYIACFVRDTYQDSEDFTYGQYWSSCFGTYYASGNF